MMYDTPTENVNMYTNICKTYTFVSEPSVFVVSLGYGT
jgi:hypothetical protein